jgi:hypothetical protein
VPTVTVDFGDGRKTVRTLSGNVATFVCAADGSVIDALPGLYDPEAYRGALERVLAFAGTLAPLDEAARAAALAAYHRGEESRMKMMRSLSKFVVEVPLKTALARLGSGRDALVTDSPPTEEELLALVRADARDAESVGRGGVHAILAAAGPAQPREVVDRIYREVLHCDLADPTLGLAPILAGEDPLEGVGER